MRSFFVLGMIAGLALPGCQAIPENWRPERFKSPVTPEPLEVAPAKPVKAEDITPANAKEKLRQLQNELEDAH